MQGTIWETTDSSEVDPWVFDMFDEEEEEELEPNLIDQSDSEVGSDEDDTPEVNEDDLGNNRSHSWESCKPPTILEAREAIQDLGLILKPPHARGRGYKECLIPLAICTRLEWIKDFLYIY